MVHLAVVFQQFDSLLIVSGIIDVCLLIGKDGTILARELRGAAIEEAIVNALAQ